MTIEESIEANARLVSEHLSAHAGFTLAYDERSVEWLDGFIERQRAREDFDVAANAKLSSMLGCFLGEAMCAEFGGRWQETDHGPGVVFANGSTAFPLAKVEKQFVNGADAGDSILGFYRSARAIGTLESTGDN
ncbi:MAG: hypothetical protein ACK4S4_03075 [Pyrinomonadaceae bacterium]